MPSGGSELIVLAAELASIDDYLLKYGVLGLIIVLWLRGFLWGKPAIEDMRSQYQELRAEKVAVEAQRDSLIATYQHDVIPVLSRLQNELTPAIVELVDQDRALHQTVTRLREEIMQLLGEHARRQEIELAELRARLSGRP